MMDSERPAQHHPSPHREGSRGQGVKECRCRQGDTSPATPSRLPLWGHRLVELACRDATAELAPSSLPPSRTVPTWASAARGGNLTQQEAPAAAATPSDAIALYKRYVAMGFRVRFSIKNNVGCEEISLFCRFPDPSATSSPPTRPLLTQRLQRRQNRSKPAICTSSTQTEVSTYTSPPRTHRPTSLPISVHASSLSVPPPAKKKRESAGVSSNSLEKWKTTQIGLCPSPHHLPLVHRQRDHPLHDPHRLHRLNRLGRHLRHRHRRCQQRRQHPHRPTRHSLLLNHLCRHHPTPVLLLLGQSFHHQSPHRRNPQHRSPQHQNRNGR